MVDQAVIEEAGRRLARAAGESAQVVLFGLRGCLAERSGQHRAFRVRRWSCARRLMASQRDLAEQLLGVARDDDAAARTLRDAESPDSVVGFHCQ